MLPVLRFLLVGVWKVLCFKNICGSTGTLCARIIQEIQNVVKRILTNKWAEMYYWLDVIRATYGGPKLRWAKAPYKTI
jgi:hypothetical protein